MYIMGPEYLALRSNFGVSVPVLVTTRYLLLGNAKKAEGIRRLHTQPSTRDLRIAIVTWRKDLSNRR
jgi:hypothetical protein